MEESAPAIAEQAAPEATALARSAMAASILEDVARKVRGGEIPVNGGPPVRPEALRLAVLSALAGNCP